MSLRLTNYNNQIPFHSEKVFDNSISKEAGGADFGQMFLGNISNPPSFVSKAYTREELLQSVEDEVRQNQYKKTLFVDMILNPYLNGSGAKFKLAGDTKSYSFQEFIQELDRRSKQ